MNAIAHYIAWHMAFGHRPVYMGSEENTPEGWVRYLDECIQIADSTPLKEYIFRYPEVQFRVLGAKWLRKQYRQLITK